MNCASARCRRAMPPRSTTKRAPEMRAAASKSSPPNFTPRSTWSSGVKSNSRGVPWRRTSTLAVSSRPSGTESCSRFGRPISQASDSVCTAASATSAAVSSPVSCSPRASIALASSPLPLAIPTALALALRSARSRSASICTALRRSSRARNASRSSTKPRRARLRATASVSVRSCLESSTSFSVLLPAACQSPANISPSARPAKAATRQTSTVTATYAAARIASPAPANVTVSSANAE